MLGIIFFAAVLQGMADIAVYRLTNPWSVIEPDANKNWAGTGQGPAGSTFPDACPCRGDAWNAALEKATHFGSEALH